MSATNVFYKCWWPCGKHCCDDEEVLDAMRESAPLTKPSEPTPQPETMDLETGYTRPKSVSTRTFVERSESDESEPVTSSLERVAAFDDFMDRFGRRGSS